MQSTYPIPQARTPAGTKRPKQRWVRWLAIPVLLAVIAGGWMWWRSSQSVPTTTTSTSPVSQGSISVTISGSGTVAAARTVEVPFQQSGTITSVDVNVGDTVKAGQTLAQIDTTSLNLALQQAQATLKAAQSSYDALKNPNPTEQELTTAQAQLDSAKAQLSQTKTGTTTKADIQSAQATLAAAQAKLNALKNPSQADSSAAENKVTQAQISLQSTKDSASQSKTNAELALKNAVNSLTSAQANYATAEKNWNYVQETGADPTNPTTTDSSGNSKKNKLNDTQKQQYADTYVQAQAQLDSAQNAVTQAQVAYDAARQSEITQVQQAETSLADAQNTLDALKNPSTSDLVQAQAAVTQAQASLTKLQQGGTAAEVTQAQASVTQAQANLDSLTAPATESNLASAEATLAQAQVAVNTAQSNLDQATVKAPFDGVVSVVSAVEGSAASSSSSAVTIVDTSKLHIDVSLTETDAAKVAVGQKVALTFDALSDVSLVGTVTTVSPVATTESNVVTYPITIEFDPGTSGVKVGMSATTEITVQQANDVLLVPTRAIQTQGETKTVTVQRGQNAQTVKVTTGLVSNGQTEITSSGANGGQELKAGDVVVITSATTSSSSTSSSSNSSNSLRGLTGSGMSGPPSGGPPGP